MAVSKLSDKEIKMANEFVEAYKKCTSSYETAIKVCEENMKYLFRMEQEYKEYKPLKIFKKRYKQWEECMEEIHRRQELNDERYMTFLRELEEIIDIRLKLYKKVKRNKISKNA